MTTLSKTQLLDALKWRYATKQFDPSKKISAQDWQTLEEALVLTPSSFGMQPWKFIVIQDPALRQQLRPYTWDQTQVTDCSHFVVFAIQANIDQKTVDAYLRRIAEVRNTPLESLAPFRDKIHETLLGGKRDKAIWALEQAFIALGNFITCAALLGIDTCPIGGFEADKYDEILDLKKSGLHAVVTCASGYRGDADKYASLPKVRFKAEDVIIHR